ncbi:MAG TPA: ATP-grasp domain-containing protein [Terriglobales bacterium]|nr:ATP-grasp domain-containing protein [Terriglobales bacterium]
MTFETIRVLVAGVGGASLGTELLKCLRDAGRYTVFGCDVSPYAYGHYQEGVAETFLIRKESYVESILELCRKRKIGVVVPGGEEPLRLLSESAHKLEESGVLVAANSQRVIGICSNKALLFEALSGLGVPAPRTTSIRQMSELERLESVPYPSVVKPATDTGGSRFVYLASDPREAAVQVSYLLKNRRIALVQEYLPLEGGEFTVGTLTLPDGRFIGSVAMRRIFDAQLSVLSRTEMGLISSGYSQGLIDDFPEVRAQAERIAMALSSVGPLNVQGRVRAGTFMPFEINPRFSASTYLRAMAGFNELDIYLRSLLEESSPTGYRVHPGYYLRSLCELRVSEGDIKR